MNPLLKSVNFPGAPEDRSSKDVFSIGKLVSVISPVNVYFKYLYILFTPELIVDWSKAKDSPFFMYIIC